MSELNEQIKKSVLEQLSWDSRLKATDIDVTLTDNTVILRGIVPTYREKVAAETDVLIVPGVKNVENRLEIVPLPHKSASDEQIRKNAGSILRLNEATEDEPISVKVDNGKVLLSGSVESYWKKARAVELVSQLKGVKDVVDELSVVPTDQPADEQVATRIIEALKHKRIDTSRILIEVDGGRVLIKGSVLDWQNFSDVYETIKNIKGVSGLFNELVIVPEL